MNHTSAYIHRTPGGTIYAMVRLPRDAKARPILDKGGEPKKFYSELEAQIAATDAICSWINGHLTGTANAFQRSHTAELERVFGGRS